jgi:SSS family solute:Na+ symporter
MVYGTVAAYNVINPTTKGHFGGSLAMIPTLGKMGYIAMTAFVINLLVTVIATLVLKAMKVDPGRDETIRGDYFADAGDPRVEKNLALDAHLTTGTP